MSISEEACYTWHCQVYQDFYKYIRQLSPHKESIEIKKKKRKKWMDSGQISPPKESIEIKNNEEKNGRIKVHWTADMIDLVLMNFQQNKYSYWLNS